MDVIVWLREMFRRELDLRPPSLAKFNEKSILIYDDEKKPIAHVTKTSRWRGFEINSLVVDPSHRGKGLSHKLLEKCGNGLLFAYTRDPRLQSALEKSGFARSGSFGFLSIRNVLISRLALASWMVLSLEIKRFIHQLKHIRDYKLYIREEIE